MDDEIDIEEHDVMDNPRIKCIFPDLSRVKIEIPEEDIANEQYGESSLPTEQPQEIQYQYEYSFETTDDSQENVAYDEENSTYFYNNEIILGSKPPADPEELYQEALHSHPIVFLENWEHRLKSSPCFCNSCEILFPTVNALDAHKMISHSYLVAMDSPQKNTARKSTVTSKYCNHCSKTFPDDTSLIKHLYELLPLNKFPKVKDEIPEPEIRKSYATPMIFPKKVKSTSRVITKIHPKTIKLEKEVDFKDAEIKPKLKAKLSRDGKFFAASSLVPKSTLFQCNVCQIGFLSCFSALQHSKCCEKVLSFEKCGICKRKIRSKDVKIHELQHNYNDKLKIYTMNKSIYERVLCKCPKCKACFDELAFWAHYQKCKRSEKKSIYCPDCDVHVATSRYKGHRQKHSIKKLTKKDFIIIEFYDQNNVNLIPEDRMEEMKAQRLKERVRKCREKKLNFNGQSKEITLYYCEFCGCCQYRLNYKGHANGSCKKISKKHCQKCGLCFTLKSYTSHLILHQKRSFSLKDIQIFSLSTGKSIEPPMSEYFECRSCAKNFICRRTLAIHDCKAEKYLTCKICSKKFNIQAFKIHKLFHSVDKLIPELMKKYNLINSMWNIVYQCCSCELVTMSYDAAVNHSQGHLNYIISDLHKQCVVCDLRIAEKEFMLHEKLHSNNESIERESFKILKYNYEDLFKTEWLMLFKELPMEHRQQILSKSIYRFTRSVKMQIEISAPSDDIKYFCMNCNNFVEGINIKQHIRLNCIRNNNLVCQTCHEIFKSLKLFLTHEGSHDISSKRHTIVSFNNECDKEFNNHLSLIESKSRNSTSLIESKSRNSTKEVPLSKLRQLLTSESGERATHKLYKCAKCDCCVTVRDSMRKHSCAPKSARRLCEICEQYFSAKKIHIHLEAHRKKPSITKDSFLIIYFNNDHRNANKMILKKDVIAKFSPKKYITPKITPKKDVIAKVSPKRDVIAKLSPKGDVIEKVSPEKTVIAKIFKCECGLHFTSMKTVEKHLSECSTDMEVSKETCSKCNLVFPTDVLVTHLVNHHHKETKIVIEKIQKLKLYKCPLCEIHFTNMNNFNSHTVDCDPNNGTHCKVCRLKFGKKCFSKHLCASQESSYVNKITVVKKMVKQTTVHRCTECDITYLQRNSFRYHYFDINHAIKKPPTPCGFCGLKFTNCSYRKHIKFHSFQNYDYKIKVLDPISGDFYFLTGNNRKSDIDTKSRKRRGSNTEENDDSSVKKAKNVPIDFDKNLSERRCTTRALDKASTSRDFETEQGDHTLDSVNNVSDTMSETFDKNDSSNDMGLSSKAKSRIMLKGYSNKLYQCVCCKQHYMKEASFIYHMKNHNDLSENFSCDICDLIFSKHTLPRHKYVHHQHMGLKKGDFIVVTETSYNTESEIIQIIKKLKGKTPKVVPSKTKAESVIVEVSENDSANNTKLSSTLSDISVKVSENSNDNVTDIIDNVNKITDNVSDDKICYFKCSDCSVCFLDQTTCFEHTLRHEILDPKTYIQCKICEFQFLIDSLKDHVNIHHSTDFLIESLIIHEYKPLGIGLDPKLDIYQAIDKVQSRFVSTTTDVVI